jgi:hypothetical protein
MFIVLTQNDNAQSRTRVNVRQIISYMCYPQHATQVVCTSSGGGNVMTYSVEETPEQIDGLIEEQRIHWYVP